MWRWDPSLFHQHHSLSTAVLEGLIAEGVGSMAVLLREKTLLLFHDYQKEEIGGNRSRSSTLVQQHHSSLATQIYNKLYGHSQTMGFTEYNKVASLTAFSLIDIILGIESKYLCRTAQRAYLVARPSFTGMWIIGASWDYPSRLGYE